MKKKIHKIENSNISKLIIEKEVHSWLQQMHYISSFSILQDITIISKTVFVSYSKNE